MRVLVGGALIVLGVLGGAATVLVHRWWWGLALGVVVALLTARALPARPGGRLAFVGGFALVVLWLTRSRSEGDYLIAQDAHGYALLGAVMLLVLGCTLTLERRTPRRSEPSTGSGAASPPGGDS